MLGRCQGEEWEDSFVPIFLTAFLFQSLTSHNFINFRKVIGKGKHSNL